MAHSSARGRFDSRPSNSRIAPDNLREARRAAVDKLGDMKDPIDPRAGKFIPSLGSESPVFLTTELHIPVRPVTLTGDLEIPSDARGLVIFAHARQPKVLPQ